jgi:enoyl-CoA hydratase/carnithine racemase
MALTMLLTGQEIAAEDALERGLVHRIARPGRLDECLEEVLADFRKAAPIALAYAKEAVRKGTDIPLPSGLTLESDLSALLQTTSDRADGVRAFLERRSPRFEGR